MPFSSVVRNSNLTAFLWRNRKWRQLPSWCSSDLFAMRGEGCEKKHCKQMDKRINKHINKSNAINLFHAFFLTSFFFFFFFFYLFLLQWLEKLKCEGAITCFSLSGLPAEVPRGCARLARCELLRQTSDRSRSEINWPVHESTKQPH